MEEYIREDINSIVKNNFENLIIKLRNKFKKNIKITNPFIAWLNNEYLFYSKLSKYIDIALWKTLEKITYDIASLFSPTLSNFNSYITEEQIKNISLLNEKNQNNYSFLRYLWESWIKKYKKQNTDLCIHDIKENKLTIFELKVSWMLDNKKAESEKISLLKQYCYLSNLINDLDIEIDIKFWVLYNNPNLNWNLYNNFSSDEILIGEDFWYFLTKDKNWYQYVLEAIENNIWILNQEIEKIKKFYLLGE